MSVTSDVEHFEDDVERNIFRPKTRMAFPRCPQPLALESEAEGISDTAAFTCHRIFDFSETPQRAKARASADLLEFDDQKASNDSGSRFNSTEEITKLLDKNSAIGHMRLRRKIEYSVRKLLAASPAPVKLRHDFWGEARKLR